MLVHAGYIPPFFEVPPVVPGKIFEHDEWLTDTLKAAMLICNRISMQRYDVALGLPMVSSLSDEEIGSGVLTAKKLQDADMVRLSQGMKKVAFAFRSMNYGLRPMTIEMESMCDCDIIVDALAAEKIIFLNELQPSFMPKYREILLGLERSGQTVRYHHMLALAGDFH